MQDKRSSSSIAVGGVFSAFCLIIMLVSSVLPFSSYAAPLFAGVMLLAVVEECGGQLAVLVYVTVSLLSIFMVPDYEAKAIFIGFFGYYPIIRVYLEKRLPKGIKFIVKQFLFNIAIVAIYYVLIFIMGIPGLMEDMGDFGKYSAVVLILMSNILFAIYDFSLDKYIIFYNSRLKRIISK